MNPISILLVDDNKTFLTVVSLFLAQYEPDFKVVGAAGSGIEGLPLACALKPDVILMDLFMPNGGGLETLPKLRASLPHTKIVILSLHPLKSYRNALIAGGADACLSKENLYTQLIPTICRVLNQPSFCQGSAAKRLF